MEILDVSLSPKVVKINDPFRLALSVVGAEGAVGFIFPFSNESLVEPLLDFSSLEKQGLLPTPVVIGETYYTGELIRPKLTPYHPQYYTITGEMEASELGKYSIFFTPIPGYTWIDGGSETREVIWSIEYDPSDPVWLYGYDLVNSDPDPSTRVIYPDGVDNVGFEPALMGATFSYGDWPSEPGADFMPRPCMLTYDCEITEYLDPNDYTKTIDGSDSHVADLSFNGNAMMQWPKIWTKRWESDGIYHFRCSNKQLDEEYECWCNYDKDDNQIDYFYTPIYYGSKDSSNRMRSISGQDNLVSQNAQSAINYAKANGDDWCIEVAADRLLMQDLLVMMFKHTNLQLVLGYGVCKSSNTTAIIPGTLNNKGLFWGSSDQTSGIKVFGMENLWGNLWRRIAGWCYKNNTQLLKITRGMKDGTTVTDYNITGDGYLQIKESTISSNSYISEMKTQNFGRLPITAGGSATTYECDYVVPGTASGTLYFASVGGRWSQTTMCGPYHIYLSSAATTTANYYGSALSCKPSLKK